MKEQNPHNQIEGYPHKQFEGYKDTHNYKTYNIVFCSKCTKSYKLPKKSYSWRCKKCHKFNDLNPDCQIL